MKGRNKIKNLSEGNGRSVNTDKILKKEFALSNKIKALIFTIAVFFVASSIFVFFKLRNSVNESIHADVDKSVMDISIQNAEAVYHDLMSRQILLDCIAKNLSDEDIYDEERFLEKLEVYVKNYNFYNMGILKPNGQLHLTTGVEMTVGKGDPYYDGLSGEPMIYESFTAIEGSGLRVNALTMPVRKNGELIFILTATYLARDLAENLSVGAFSGEGYSFILDSHGEAMIFPQTGEDEKYLEMVEFINDSKNLLPKKGKSRFTTFCYGQEEYCAYFAELGINDWYVMTCVAKDRAYSGAYETQRRVSWGMGFLWGMILLILSILFIMFRRHQRKMQELLFIDDLLKEYNFEYLKVIFPHIPKEKRKNMAFLVMDVDKFKAINLTYGSRIGDELLHYINNTFHEMFPQDGLYRHVSDQFAALVTCDSSKEEVREKVERFLAKVEQDIAQKKIVPFVLSVGICMLEEYDELHVAYSDALIAENKVKKNHISKYLFYDKTMREASLANLAMESDFSDALKKGEFKVYYQPKYDMRDGSIVGAEALVRWIREDGTMISPGEFIPCFEETGQIAKLDDAMLKYVCTQMKEMETEGLMVPQVSVNFSRLNLSRPGVTVKIKELLQSMKIDPSRIAFEITESALYDDTIILKKIVSDMHELGCQVNMDDYGTGISSLNSLANIEFDVIKLDKSFIDKIGDRKMEAVIRSTIQLSGELGIALIAEGVETAEQAEYLVERGCYYAQGFYYSRPVPEAEYKTMLRNMMGRGK